MTAKAEALEETVSFDFDGETYTVPTTSEWSIDSLEAVEDGKAIRWARTVMGEDQWTTFRKTHSKARDVDALAEEIAKAVGLTGN